MLNMSFNINSGTQHHYTEPESGEGTGRKPSPLLTKRETQCERSQPAGQQCRSHGIEALMSPLLRSFLAIKVQGGHKNEQADRHIDVKDPAPAQKVRDDPSDCRPGGYAK